MYPYGSGSPYPQPPNQSMYPQNMPFGAGFQAPSSQSPYPQQAGGYPSQTPYPSQPQTGQSPYPAQLSYPSQSPYPSSQGGYPSSQGGYPSVSQSDYPPAGGSPYPAQFGIGVQAPSGAYGSHTPTHQSSPYPAAHPSVPPQNCPYPPSSTNTGYPQNTSSHYGQAYGQATPYATQQTTAQYHTAPTSAINSQKKGTPTLIPPQSFDPVKDAHDLRKAMKGFGTDEDGLINVLCQRSNAQRQEIQRQYKTHFGRDLIEDLRNECSGNFELLMISLCHPIVEYYCRELCEAMAGMGTDEDVLIETMCTLSNNEIEMIKQTYRRMYGRDLDKEFRSETSGFFKRLLVALTAGGRDESGVVDLAAAQADAKELLRAGELCVGTDEVTFNRIMCSRNYQQLKLIFEEYQKMTGHPLEKAIKNEFSGDIEEGLVSIYRCVMDKAEFFASRLHKSLAGIGTNDRQLIRIIVTRCEIDMQDIKTAFERKYGKSLKSWIKGDTSGDYKHALYALIGEQRSS